LTQADLKTLYALVTDTRDELRMTIDQCCRDLDTQFKRIAQLQVQLDEVRAAGKTKRKP